MGELELKLDFEHFPGRSFTLLLFKDVSNASELDAAIKSGSLKTEMAIMNAAMIGDAFVAHLAAFQALVASSREKLRTRTLHAEVVFYIAASKQISESFRRFGVSDKAKHVLVGIFDASPDAVKAAKDAVKGTQVSVDQLPTLMDRDALVKHHGIEDAEQELSSLVECVVGRVGGRVTA
ncbi:unnamed protein product [Pedinophyceae sp. YPF-701]|nr:unnamed protein product [Pedinophyceae sp. YPF-701]